MQKDKNVKVVIRSGKKNPYKYRKALLRYGMSYDTKTNSWTTYINNNKSQEKRLKRFCRKRGLKIEITGESLVRNRSYRRDFFYEYGKDKYLCAYCGKRLARETVTVDHIIPIGIFKNRRRAGLLTLIRIDNINDTKNLAPACSRCNSKKGMKTGLWILRGFLGKSYARRKAMNIIRNTCYFILASIFFVIFLRVIVII